MIKYHCQEMFMALLLRQSFCSLSQIEVLNMFLHITEILFDHWDNMTCNRLRSCPCGDLFPLPLLYGFPFLDGALWRWDICHTTDNSKSVAFPRKKNVQEQLSDISSGMSIRAACVYNSAFFFHITFYTSFTLFLSFGLSLLSGQNFSFDYLTVSVFQ